MKLKELLKEARDLKGLAVTLSADIENGSFIEAIEHVVAGNMGGDNVYNHIVDTLDTTKKNYGKRGANLIAYVGNESIKADYDVNGNQALSIWKKLSNEDKKKLDDVIKSELKNLEEELAE